MKMKVDCIVLRVEFIQFFICEELFIDNFIEKWYKKNTDNEFGF